VCVSLRCAASSAALIVVGGASLLPPRFVHTGLLWLQLEPYAMLLMRSSPCPRCLRVSPLCCAPSHLCAATATHRAATTAAMAGAKIKVDNPVVDLDGDEMTRCVP
jgi:hypothetical protein